MMPVFIILKSAMVAELMDMIYHISVRNKVMVLIRRELSIFNTGKLGMETLIMSLIFYTLMI